ncbi:MAG TPA: serine hydrolase [Allosphingosinicella sp.]|jgi:CubicO group peptidase (beta-lactamase class C family)|nr:serine hydrolase [Allosphingosinicella sp.]
MRSFSYVLAGILALFGVALAAQKIVPLQPIPVNQKVSSGTPVAPPPPAGGVQLTAGDVNSWLDGYMPGALRTADIPGAVVVVVKDGKILTARGFGYANVDKKTPVDPDRTLFRPGSVSKLVTWTAVMQLVEQHKLDLDRDVNAYLDFKIPPYEGKPITLRQIMTHTAGFEEVVKGLLLYDAKKHVSLESYLKRWTPTRIFAPGTTQAYSNWATSLAGYMVQRVSGEDFDSYLDHHIFGPLGMKNSTFRQPLPANLAAQMSGGYVAGKDKGYEFVEPAPAGSLSSTGTDMARFMIAHLQDGQLDGQRILQPATAQMMHNSPLGPVNPMTLLPPLNRMELGFFETNINGREVIGHLGDTNAFHTSFHMYMKENAGLYLSFNSPGKAGAVQGLRTGVFEDFSDRYFPNIAPPDGRVDAKTAAQHAQMMAGHWIVSRRIDTSFLASFSWLLGQEKVGVGPKGELIIPSLVNAGGRPRQWVEIAPFVWRDKEGHDLVAAKVVNGQVVRWSFDLAAPFEVYDRVPLGLNTAWILPALYLSIAILLLTFLSWPVGWLARRRYKAQSDLEGRALLAQRASRIAAGLVILLLLGWAIGTVVLLSDVTGNGGDGFFWLMQILSLVVFVAAVPVTAWTVWQTWRDKRRWTRKLWSILVFLAALMVLYFAARFNLFAMTVHY